MEHRWGQRLVLNEPVRLRVQGGRWVGGRICNASISGALIVTRMSAAPLSRVSVRFTAPRGTRADELQAEVVRSTREGLAIEWTEFAPKRVRTLMLIPVFETLWSPRETTVRESTQAPRAPRPAPR